MFSIYLFIYIYIYICIYSNWSSSTQANTPLQHNYKPIYIIYIYILIFQFVMHSKAETPLTPRSDAFFYLLLNSSCRRPPLQRHMPYRRHWRILLDSPGRNSKSPDATSDRSARGSAGGAAAFTRQPFFGMAGTASAAAGFGAAAPVPNELVEEAGKGVAPVELGKDVELVELGKGAALEDPAAVALDELAAAAPPGLFAFLAARAICSTAGSPSGCRAFQGAPSKRSFR